jgi:Cdc6-like AAA superfamily ATPase
MASDQFDRRGSDKLVSIRLKLREAYRPGQPVTEPRMLAGRTDLLTTLIRAIEDRHFHTIVFGERGIGKTSLLHVLSQLAREARYHVAYISCGASASFDETFRAVAAKIPLLFHEDFGPTSPEAERGDTIADLLPNAEVTPRLASDLCTKIIGTRVLVVLDEFERARSTEFRRSVGEFLKNLSDRSIRCHLVIAGVASDLEDLLEPGALVPRNVVSIEVPKMSADEIEELVHNGERVSSLTFEREVIDAVTLSANGLPYLANLVCQQAGLVGLAAGRTVITLDDVPRALNDILAEVRSRVSKGMRAGLDSRVSDGARSVLGRLASAAQTSGGVLTPDDLKASFPEPGGATRALMEIEKLSACGVVTVQEDKRLGRAFTFYDANVTAYLWLATVEAQFQRNEDAPRPAAPEALAG